MVKFFGIFQMVQTYLKIKTKSLKKALPVLSEHFTPRPTECRAPTMSDTNGTFITL